MSSKNFWLGPQQKIQLQYHQYDQMKVLCFEVEIGCIPYNPLPLQPIICQPFCNYHFFFPFSCIFIILFVFGGLSPLLTLPFLYCFFSSLVQSISSIKEKNSKQDSSALSSGSLLSMVYLNLDALSSSFLPPLFCTHNYAKCYITSRPCISFMTDFPSLYITHKIALKLLPLKAKLTHMMNPAD